MLQVTRRWWLVAGFSAPFSLLPFAAALGAQPLELRLESGNLLRISAPGFQFLSGRPLDRLKNGSSVSFLAQLSISTDAYRTVQTRALTRFALSYDIWEERFSAVRFSLSQVEEPARKSSPLNQAAIQNWCLDNLTIDVSRYALDQQFWVRLEWRADEAHETAGVIGEPGISISRLIDLFSRPAKPSQDRLPLEAGPFRLMDLRRRT